MSPVFKIFQQSMFFVMGISKLRFYNCAENVFYDKAPQSFPLNNKYYKYSKLEILCSITRYDSIRSDCLFALSITLPPQRLLTPHYISFHIQPQCKAMNAKKVYFKQRKPPSLHIFAPNHPLTSPKEKTP